MLAGRALATAAALRGSWPFIGDPFRALVHGSDTMPTPRVYESAALTLGQLLMVGAGLALLVNAVRTATVLASTFVVISAVATQASSVWSLPHTWVHLADQHGMITLAIVTMLLLSRRRSCAPTTPVRQLAFLAAAPLAYDVFINNSGAYSTVVGVVILATLGSAFAVVDVRIPLAIGIALLTGVFPMVGPASALLQAMDPTRLSALGISVAIPLLLGVACASRATTR